MGITKWEEEDEKSFRSFVSRVGWYKQENYLPYSKLVELVDKDYQKVPKGSMPTLNFYRWVADEKEDGLAFKRDRSFLALRTRKCKI